MISCTCVIGRAYSSSPSEKTTSCFALSVTAMVVDSSLETVPRSHRQLWRVPERLLKPAPARVDDSSVSEPLPRDDRFREELIERALSLPLGDQAALARVAQLC